MERTVYMKKTMNDTYAGVAIEAIERGFDEAWERLIAERLRTDYEKGISEAEVIIDSVKGKWDNTQQQLMAAAHLITSSKIPQPCE